MRGNPTLLALLLVLPLAAVPLAAGQVTLTGGVANVTPVVGAPSFGASFDPTANGNTAVPVTVSVVDSNGCSDVNGGSSSVLASILKSSDSSVVVTATQMTAGSCTAGVTQAFSLSLNMPYYAAATTYKVRVVATDRAAAANTATSAGTFTYTSLVAMGTSTPTGFSFGSAVSPGSSSPTNQGVAVYNGGNVQVDVTVLGTDLTLASPAATLSVDSVKYSLNSDMSSSAALATGSTTLTAFDLAPASGASKTLYLQLVVPSAASSYLPAGTYTGTVTVGVVSG